MKVAITDANIFIDLIYAGFLEELFGIEVEIHTTLNVLDELNDNQQDALSKYIKKNLLTVHPLDELEIPEPIKTSKRLSDADKSVFSLALQLDAFILSGDAVVRQISGVQKIEVHGILWLLDQFIDKKLINRKKATQQLKSLQGFNRRLPADECEKRYSQWA